MFSNTASLKIAAILAASLLWASGAAVAQQLANDPTPFLEDPPKQSTIKGRFSLTTIGELLYSYPIPEGRNPDFDKVVKLIAGGDVTIAIQEGVFFDLKSYRGMPGGGGLWGVAEKARHEKAMGIDMVSLANNHSNDWGHDGLAETQRLLDEAGIVHSGAGRTLQEARQPGILSTPKGRIALISTSSTYRPLANATDKWGDVPARPGISPMRVRRINVLPQTQFDVVRQIAIDTARFSQKPPNADATEVVLGDQAYRAGPKTGVDWDMNIYDHAELIKSVREAKAKSDFVIFTIHAHESPTGLDDDNPTPPDFLVELFHNAVDAGADFILGGGQHAMRGIEIYRGKPLLYGIGAFLLSGDIRQMQDQAHDAYPKENGESPPRPIPNVPVTANPGGINPPKWYDGVAVTADYDGPRLKQLRLYPLDLGNSTDKARRGIPYLASPENANRILADIQQYSQQFGTKIVVENSVGIIRVP